MTKESKQQPKPSKEDEKKMEEFRKKQLETAEKFKTNVMEKYKDFVKAVVLFGSLVRGDFHSKSDIDMLVVIDDTIARFSPEMKLNFDQDIYQIGKELDDRIVVQPAWTLTEFWDMARIGHPLLYTIVRDGWALYDTGFWIPIRKLLEFGKIPATLEAVEKLMESAPQKIERVESAKLFMVAEDLYYAMLNSAQAVLMFMGISTPSPKHTAISVKENLVEQKLLEKKYLDDLEDVIQFRKDAEHKDITRLKGEKLDMFIDNSIKFVQRMDKLLFEMQLRRKQESIEKNYEIMMKVSLATLKELKEEPEKPKDLPNKIKSALIETKRIEPYYEEVFKKVVVMRKMLDDKKLDKIPQREVELLREYVRRYVRDLTPFLPKKEDKK